MPPNALDFETHYQANRRELTRLAFLLLGEQTAATAVIDDATIAFVGSGSERPPRQELARLVVARCRKLELPTQTQVESDLHRRILALPVQQRCVVTLDHLLQQDDVEIAQTLGRHSGSVRSLRDDAMATLALNSNEKQSFPFDLRSIGAHAETPDHWAAIDDETRGATADGARVRSRLLVPVLLTACVLAYLVLATGTNKPTLTDPTLSIPTVSTSTVSGPTSPTTVVDKGISTTTVPPLVVTVQLLSGEKVLGSRPLVVLGAQGPAPMFPTDDLGEELTWVPIEDLPGAVERTRALGDDGLGVELGGPVTVDKHTMVGQHDGRVVSTVWFRVDAVEPKLCVGLIIDFELTSTSCRQGAALVVRSFDWLLELVTRTAYAPDGKSVTVSYLPHQASVVAAIDSSGTRLWQRPVGGVSIIPVNSQQPLAKLAVLDSVGLEMFPSNDEPG